jgi:ABC-2 type transport system permease protein
VSAASVGDVASFPSAPALLARQTADQLRTFWRIPVAVFFTVGLPLVMLVLFNAIFGNEVITSGNETWTLSQFYTAGLAAFAAVAATFTNLANMVPIRRDEGVLKRWRGTPLPTHIYVAGFVCSAIAIAFVSVVAMLALGAVAWDLDVDPAKLPAALVTFLVGVAAFAALGMALASLIRSASEASAAANAVILPLAFVSNVFIQTDDAPRWFEVIGDVFPLKPFVESFQDCFNPTVPAPAFDWAALGFVALWGAAGLVVALTRFTWEPSGSAPRGRRSRRTASST